MAVKCPLTAIVIALLAASVLVIAPSGRSLLSIGVFGASWLGLQTMHLQHHYYVNRHVNELLIEGDRSIMWLLYGLLALSALGAIASVHAKPSHALYSRVAKTTDVNILPAGEVITADTSKMHRKCILLLIVVAGVSALDPFLLRFMQASSGSAANVMVAIIFWKHIGITCSGSIYGLSQAAYGASSLTAVNSAARDGAWPIMVAAAMLLGCGMGWSR